VSLISHRFNVLANKILLQNLSLVISPRYFESNMRLFQRLSTGGSLGGLVRCIEVDDIYGPLTDASASIQERMPPLTQPYHYLNYVDCFGKTFCYLELDWYRAEGAACFGTNLDQMLGLWILLSKCPGLEVFRYLPAFYVSGCFSC
jgi:hypothetical protein